MFGKHLIARGLLTERELLELLDRQARSRLTIGRLAFEREMLDMDQLIAILEAQPGKGLRFGETAIAMGCLTEAQLEELLELQLRTLRPLGQMLAEEGVLPIDVLEKELAAYEAGRSRA